jgi:hypothetical protein
MEEMIEKTVENKKETPSEIHAKLLCIMTEVFFLATAGLHYQVKVNQYFSLLGLLMQAGAYLSQRNIFCKNAFVHDEDLFLGRNLIKKFNDIYDEWRDDSYDVPFFYVLKNQDISENKMWEKLISHVETFEHHKEASEPSPYPYSIYEKE